VSPPVESSAKYGPKAAGWTRREYADPERYLGRRAEAIEALGPRLERGDRVLDMACGDGGQAEPLLARGLVYLGVDASQEMVAAARARLAGRAQIVLADLNEFTPTEPVAASVCFRAIYYAQERVALFRRLATFTEKKLVFDLNPRQYDPAAIREELRQAGWPQLSLQPFFVPQHVKLGVASTRLLALAERNGPLARALLRLRFSYLCAAWR
jgi:SAM-dependent methyltransferase